MESEQMALAERLVHLNLPVGLLRASGYLARARSPSQAPHPPPEDHAATAFLTDCLQKMPHHRRDCGSLLESDFIKRYRSRPVSVCLDWIRDPCVALPSPDPDGDRNGSEQAGADTKGCSQEGKGDACVHQEADADRHGTASTGLLTAAKLRRKKGEQVVHEVQEMVKKCLVTAEEVSFLRNVFNFIDKDGDGVLQKAEILQILEFLGERKSALEDAESVQQFIARLGIREDDEDSGLSFEQFIEWWTVMDYWNMIGIQKESKETALLRESFNSYDDDASGFIDVDELQNLLLDLGHNFTLDELKRMMRLICDEKDAEGLNFEQFTSLTLRLPYWKKIGVHGSHQIIF